MRYADFLAKVRSEDAAIKHFKNQEDTDITVRLRVAKSLQLVSGEFHPAVYNSSKIVEILEERWKADSLRSAEEMQEVEIAGGPNTYLMSKEDGTSPHNDFVSLIKRQFEWECKNRRQFYQVTTREELHYWLLDNRFIYFQPPHNDSSYPLDRERLFCDSPEIAKILRKEFERNVDACFYHRLYTPDSVENYFTYRIWRWTENRSVTSKITQPKKVYDDSLIESRREEILESIDQARGYFERVKPSLLAQEEYAGKYIAVSREAILACDSNDLALAERVEQTYPDTPYFVGKVSSCGDSYSMSA